MASESQGAHRSKTLHGIKGQMVIDGFNIRCYG
ncbi:hypothetical protein A2U01_0118683, partial [Trifolium medium]|nr:hypothetical protein [Trifolium medium]